MARRRTARSAPVPSQPPPEVEPRFAPYESDDDSDGDGGHTPSSKQGKRASSLQQALRQHGSRRAPQDDENEANEEFDYDFFDYQIMSRESTVALFGPRGSGKSTIIANCLRAMGMSRGFVMCPTPEVFQLYDRFVPTVNCFDYFNEELLARVMVYQFAVAMKIHKQWYDSVMRKELAAEQLRRERWQLRMTTLRARARAENWTRARAHEEFYKERADEAAEHAALTEIRTSRAYAERARIRAEWSLWCVLDDLASDPTCMKSHVLQQYVNNGRHYMVFLIVAVQDSVQLKANLRGGIDYVIMFYDGTPQNFKRSFDKLVGMFRSADEFQDLMEEASRRRLAVVFCKRRHTPDLKQKIFWLEPKPLSFLRTIKLGDAVARWINEIFYDPAKLAFLCDNEQAMQDKVDQMMSAGKRSTGRGKANSKTSSTASSSGSNSGAKKKTQVKQATAEQLSRLSRHVPQFEKLDDNERKRNQKRVETLRSKIATLERRRTDTSLPAAPGGVRCTVSVSDALRRAAP